MKVTSQIFSATSLMPTFWPAKKDDQQRPCCFSECTVERAKPGNDDRLAAIRRLDEQARMLDGHVGGATLAAFLADERARATEYGGRTVFDR